MRVWCLCTVQRGVRCRSEEAEVWELGEGETKGKSNFGHEGKEEGSNVGAANGEIVVRRCIYEFCITSYEDRSRVAT